MWDAERTYGGNEQYGAAVESCEATARKRSHTLSVWYPADEQLHASLCQVCGAMVWLAWLRYEKSWRVGGTALEQDCLQRRANQLSPCF